MKRFRWWQAAATILVVASLVGATTTLWPRERLSQEEIRRQLGDAVQTLARDGQFSGTILLAKDGDVLLADGYGLADRETRVHNDVDSVYSLASVGKMFTAVAIGQLVSQGKIRLEDTIREHLPNYRPDMGAKVTIGHLLSHTSGLPDIFSVSADEYKKIIPSGDPHRDYLRLFEDAPLNFEPGTRVEYSNSGFLILGAIIEAVSGRTYFDYVEANIFKPAGMMSTFWRADQVAAGRRALPYTTGHPGPEGAARWLRVDPMSTGPQRIPEPRAGAHGGGLSTAGDLLKFLQALRSNRLLDKRTLDLLLAGRNGEGEGAFAFGFSPRQSRGYVAQGHGGDFEGVHAHAYMYPGGYDVIVLSNYDALPARWWPILQKIPVFRNNSGADGVMATVDDLLLR